MSNHRMRIPTWILGGVLFLFPNLGISQTVSNAVADASPNLSATGNEAPSSTSEVENHNPPDTSEATLSDRGARTRARAAYMYGRNMAEVENNYVEALRYFEIALSYIRLPIILYATAQCRRDLGDDIEALLLFDETLEMNSASAPADRLEEGVAAAAFNNMEDLLKRFVELHIEVSKGDDLLELKVNDAVWATTRILSRLEGKLDIDKVIGSEKERLTALKQFTFDPCPIEKKFLIKQGKYDFELLLKSGRVLFIKDRMVKARKNFIDLNDSSLPARLIVEEVPEGTHFRLENLTDERLVRSEPFKERARDVEFIIPGNADYRVIAKRKGFIDINRTLFMKAAQRTVMDLEFKPNPIYKNWKFWLGIGMAAVAVGIVVPVVYANNK